MKRYMQKGFTVIELTIYIALMSVLLLVISRIFISSLDVQTESESVSAVQQDGRFILARLSHDVSQADSITDPTSLGQSSETLALTRGGNSYLYVLNGTTLELSDGVDAQRLNSPATAIRDLTFTRVGNPDGKPTIRVSFIIESTIANDPNPEIQTFQTTLGTR